MKKLIAAALCIAAIGAQALEIKGLTPGDKFDCNKLGNLTTPETLRECKNGNGDFVFWGTFLGIDTLFSVYLSEGSISIVSFTLSNSERYRAAITALGEKYGKPIAGRDERDFLGIKGYCNFHQWKGGGKQLEITACKNFELGVVRYAVELKTLPKASPLNKSDI